MKFPKPFPKGPLGPNNAPVHPAGEPPDTSEAHHKAVEAVVRAQRRIGLMNAAQVARKQGLLLRAAALEAEIASLGEP